jgi:hypothetical protein
LAVKVEEVAVPFALVVSVSVGAPLLAKMPLAPDAGAVKVTVAPLTGVWPSITDTCNFVGNAVPAGRLCVVPLTAVIVALGVLGGVLGFDELPLVLHDDSASTKPRLTSRSVVFRNLNGYLRRAQL